MAAVPASTVTLPLVTVSVSVGAVFCSTAPSPWKVTELAVHCPAMVTVPVPAGKMKSAPLTGASIGPFEPPTCQSAALKLPLPPPAPMPVASQ